MDEGDREAGAPLWTDGDMLLRLQGWERDADHIVKVKQPYAVLGAVPTAIFAYETPRSVGSICIFIWIRGACSPWI